MNNLPATPTDLLGSMQKTIATIANADDSGGVHFMKMGKDGLWSYGAEDIQVEDESHWAVNPASFKTGYIAWQQGNTSNGPVGEEMVAITDDPIQVNDLPDVNAPWTQQVGFQLACVNGQDKGEQAVFKTSSKGGRGAFSDFIQQVMTHYKANPNTDKIVPIVALATESYTHKEYGKIYKPLFSIVEWGTMDGGIVEEEPAAKTDEAPAPRRRRRRTAA